jgi:hypothetical protein
MVKKEKITCDICGKSFDSRKQMNQHKHDVHDNMVNHGMTEKESKSYNKRSSKKKLSKRLIVIIIGVGILIAITGGIGAYYYTMGSNSSSLSSTTSRLTVDGIQCNPMEHVAFHIHAHLDIIINGKSFTVPSQIGIKFDERCLYWLHTHDETGIIHVEAPEKRDFTVGQFFDIWNEKFSNSQIFNYTTSSGGADNNNNNTLTVYVNGHKISGMNYRDIKLNAHDEIAIVYGKSPTQQSTTTIPSNYIFPKGL